MDAAAMLGRLAPARRAELESADFGAKAEACFDKADVSGNQILNDDEMLPAVEFVFEQFAEVPHDWVTEANVKDNMLKFDANKDGKIEKSEFVAFIRWSIAKSIDEYFSTSKVDSSQRLERASTALATLGSGGLKSCCQELKSLGHPPAPVITVVTAVAVLLGYVTNPKKKNFDAWPACQKMMSNARQFAEKIQQPGEVPDATIAKAKALLDASDPPLTVEDVKKKSKAAAVLLEYVQAFLA